MSRGRTLTPAGVLHFATKIGWERFSVGDQTIRDKSKADILAKVLVILQVSWSLFQCITRQASGYPLTVLEVHILVHAACAMLMYALWFRKPLDVGDPSSVDVSSAAENVALSLMRSSGTAFRPFTALECQTQFETSNVGAVHQVFMELLFSPLRALRRRPKHASEADFLIFDMDCLHAVQEGPSDSEDQVVSVLDNLADGQRVQGRKSACVGDLGQPRKTGQVAAAPSPTLMNPVDLESQSHRGVVGQDATFHRQSLVDEEPATVLVTGQTLSSGIGPGVVQTTSNETLSFSLRTRLARVTGLNRLAPSRLEIHEIDALLNPLLGWPLGLPKFPSFFLDHKVAICLSQKDLLRWRLAGFAIAREARINSSMLARFDQRGAITFSPELWRNSRGNEHYRLHRRLQPLSEKSWPYPPDLIGSLGDFILRSPNLSREPIWVLLDTDTYYYSSANGEAERAKQAIILVVSMVSVSTFYAGVHLALWNYDFPTEVERLLWRIASCALGAPFAIFIRIGVGLAFNMSRQWVKAFVLMSGECLGSCFPSVVTQKRPTETEAEKMARLVKKYGVPSWWRYSWLRWLWYLKAPGVVVRLPFMACLVAGTPLYILSRVYIVVEAFVSLRRVPVGVYETTTWAQYIPHF